MREVAEFIEHGLELVGWSRNTEIGYRGHLAQLVAFATARLGRCPEPADITSDLLQRFDTVKARGGMKQRSRQTMQACFRSFVNWLSDRGKVTGEQYEAIQKMPRVRVNEKPRRHYITGEQVRAMLSVCPRVSDSHTLKLAYRSRLASAVLSILCYTGARRSAVCALMLSDVDMAATPPTITFRMGKGRKTHVLPLHSNAVRAVRAWIDRRPTDSPSLFAVPVERRSGELETVTLTPSRMVGILKEVARLAEVVNVDVLRPHAYRRFAASNLLRSGASLKVVSEFLAHSSIDVTEKYLSCDAGEMAANVERMTLSDTPVPAQKSGRHRQDLKRRIPR